MSDHTEVADVARSPWPDRVRRGLAGLVAAAVAGGVMLSGPVAMAAPPPPPSSSADAGGDADKPDHRKPKEYTGKHREPGRPSVWPPVFGKPGKHRDAGIFETPHVAKHIKRGPVTQTLVTAKNKVTGKTVSVWLELDSRMSKSERNEIIRCVFKCLGKKYFGGEEANLAEISGKTYAQAAFECAATCLDEWRKRKAKKDKDGDDGDDTGGTPAKQDPKKPLGPSSGVTKTPDGTSPSTKTPVKTPVKTGSLPVVGPKVRVPTGVRGGRSGMVGDIYGGVMTQVVVGDMARRQEEWYQKALKDPKLRDRMIDDYLAGKKLNPFQKMVRPQQEFSHNTALMLGERLIAHRNALTTAKKVADKSNSDPLYQQARRECGGYDTCVTDRVKKLRDKNAKDIAKADKNARKSNADPLYQQARRECGGYDTCVMDRVKKLRDKNAKDIAKADKNARKSNADPLYQQARRECGGYDTCVMDRVKKLRAAKAAAKPVKTPTKPEKVTTKKQTVEPKKPVETKKVTKKPTEKKIDPAVAKKQYEAASKVCGGYDTCVKDRLAKVRGTGTKAETVPKKQEPKKAKEPKKKTKK
ncbi:hypothetical protein [Saccharothrix sp. NRRL B-16348]|uniref:hypothetical protein n=1 Tax=Saccharothrix sp. NRRL B-16348 TaxID=1415542 RepID=UPI000A72DBCB|nr:hypothetical protein [Saccharothrix sp. NRRL B-16348]